MLAIVLAARRQIAILCLLGALVALSITLLIPKKYTSTVSFTPVASDIPAGALTSLASEVGVNLAGSDPSQSPEFYGALLQTPDILEPLVMQPYAFRDDDGKPVRKSFIELYGISEGDSGKTIAEALRKLQSDVLTVSFDRETSIVTVDVKTKWREVSFLMATRLLELIDQFNQNTRRVQGRDELAFLTQRLDTARAELHTAEAKLQAFVIANRGYQTDPTLTFEHDRLQREIGLRQDVYATLTQATEQARLKTARNTPSISPVANPARALRFDRRHALPKTLLGFFAGLCLALLNVLGRDVIAGKRSDLPAQFETLEVAWTATLSDLKSLWFIRRPRAGRAQR